MALIAGFALVAPALVEAADPAPWSALILKLGSVNEETDDEEEPVRAEEQIIGILKQQQAGLQVTEICRLKALDEQNRKLKKLLAAAMLDVATPREALG